MLKFCPLSSGSSGNVCYVGTEKAGVLIDAGLPGKRVEELMLERCIDPGSLRAILVTHEHSDHIQGVGIISRRFDVPIYANAPTWQAMEPKIGGISPRNIRIFETGQDFYIRDICVTPVPISHDAAEPVGFTFISHGRKVAALTDLGYASCAVLDAAEYADVLLIESNHDIELVKNGPYPGQLKRRILSKRGHLSNEDCAKALVALYAKNVRRVILGHLSKDNNHEQLALETVTAELIGNGILPDKDMPVLVAHRDRSLDMIELSS